MRDGAMRFAGRDGLSWLGTSYPTEGAISAYYLNFVKDAVYPSNVSQRWEGFTVQKNKKQAEP